VQCWADLQLMHRFCYDNIAPYAKCQRVLVLTLCLVYVSSFVLKMIIIVLSCVCVRYSSRPSCLIPVHTGHLTLHRRRQRPMMLERKISGVDRKSWKGRRRNWNVASVRCSRPCRDNVSLLEHLSTNGTYRVLSFRSQNCDLNE